MSKPVTEYDRQKALLACDDSAALYNIAEWLMAYQHEVLSNGQKGEAEMSKVIAMAPRCIKILANYI